MTQAAYDVEHPNNSGRRSIDDRVLMIFRLYRLRGELPGLRNLPTEGSSSFLRPLREGVQAVRGFIGDVREQLRSRVLAPLGANNGRILEREYRFILILEQTFDQRDLRSHFVYTRDGYFIDTPMRHALGVTNFRLAGRTHWTPATVNGVPVDGDAAVKEFQELVEDYFDPETGLSTDFQLVWYNLLNPVSAEDPFGAFEWTIHPRSSVQLRQSAERPLQRYFSFDFYGLQSNRDLAKSEDGFLAGLFSRSLLGQLLEAVGLEEFAGLIDDVFGTIDDVRGLLGDLQNIVLAATDYIRGVNQFIVASIAKVRGVLTDIDVLIDLIDQGIDLAKNIPDLTEDQLDLLAQQYPGMNYGSVDASTGERQSTNQSVIAGVLAVEQARAIRNFLLALLANPRIFSPQLARGEQRTIAVEIEEPISLERLAYRSNVTPAAIIEANTLQFPFIDPRERPERKVLRLEREREDLMARDTVSQAANRPADYAVQIAVLEDRIAAAEREAEEFPAVPNVLYLHDTVRIPQPAPAVIPSVVGVEGNQILVSGEPVTEEERLFGIDLLLTRDGDLVWNDLEGDAEHSRGLDNIQRAQERYVRLPLGVLRFAPAIGNYAYEDLAQWQGPGTNYLLAYAMYRTISQDPRVRKVSHLRAETRGGRADLVYNAVLINGHDLPELRAPAEAA